MLRITRTLRGTLAAAVATGAMLVLPGAALAAPDWSTSTLTSTGPYVSGETATYVLEVVNTGDGLDPTGGTVTLREDGDPLTVEGTPSVAACAAGADQSTKVTTSAGSANVEVQDGFAAGCAKVTLTVRLPQVYDGNFDGAVFGTPGGQPLDVSDASRVVMKGSGSALKLSFPADAPKAVGKDGTYTTTVNVTNTGTGAAEFARSSVSVWGGASVFSPDWTGHPAFSPVSTLDGCTLEGGRCLLGTLAPGETKSHTVTVTGLTHYGTIELSPYADDASGESAWASSLTVQVTNGKTSTASVDVDGPQVAAGSTDLTFRGEFVNAGVDALDQALLTVRTTSFNAEGKRHDIHGGTEVDSIRSITLSNGATCAPSMNNYATPAVARKNTWDCPLTGIAAGQRVTYTVVANFGTATKDETAFVNVILTTPNFLSDDSAASDWSWLQLNAEKTVDLETSLSSQAVVGADRRAAVTITVKNNGNTKAERVAVFGDVRNGAFDAETLPATCTGVSKPMYARCSLGSIEPGQSASLVVNVKAGAALGSLAVTFSASQSGPGTETNSDNDSSVLALQVVRANVVPLTGVVVAKPAKQTIAQVVKAGVPASITCPNACRVVGELQVNRGQAQKVGLVTPPRKGTRRAKPLPYIVIGKAVKTKDSAGKVTLSIKLTRAYKLKVAKLSKPLTVARVLTVTSTDAANKDASFKQTQAVSFKPAKKPRKPRR